MMGSVIQQHIEQTTASNCNAYLQNQWISLEHTPHGTAADVDTAYTIDSSIPPPPPPPPFQAADAAAPAILRLADAIAPPELGSAELPSIGSLLHHKGECKPCTFFHTRGCENKEDCKFCHLCGPGEKKKRLKQLKAAQREATWLALENAKATLASYNAGQLPEENIEA